MLSTEINPFVRHARYLNLTENSFFNEAVPLDARLFYTLHGCGKIKVQNTEYEMKEGFVLADCNIHAKGKVTYLPIYMIMFIKNDSEDYYLN